METTTKRLRTKTFKDEVDSWRPANDASEPILGHNIVSAAVHNRELLLHHVRSKGPISRIDLALLTGLTPPAVFKITKDLLEEKWLTASRTREGLRGQPTSLLSINPEAAFSIGSNVDRDHVTLVILDFGGTVRECARHDIRYAAPADVRRLISEHSRSLIGAYGSKNLIGIGLSMPDDFAMNIDVALEEAWRTTAFDTFLADIIDLPVVRENDAAAGAIGEMTFGAGLGVNSFFDLYISVGLGGGLVINRHYVRGSHGRSGELGYLPQINPFRSTKSALRQPIGGMVSISGLQRALEAGGRADTALEKLDAADAQVKEIVETWSQDAADLLYLPLLSTISVIDPDAILVGGNLPAYVLETLSREINKRLSLNVGMVWLEKTVRPGRLTANAAAVGAAVLAFRDIWDRDLMA